MGKPKLNGLILGRETRERPQSKMPSLGPILRRLREVATDGTLTRAERNLAWRALGRLTSTSLWPGWVTMMEPELLRQIPKLTTQALLSALAALNLP